MSEKTEPPSPKRLRDAREKEGNVLFSKEIASTAIFLAITGSLAIAASFGVKQLLKIFDVLFVMIAKDNTTAMHDITTLVIEFISYFFYFSVGVGTFIAIAANVGQFGFLLSFAKFTKGMDSLNIVQNAQNIFTKKNLFGFFFNVFKVIVVSIAIYYVITRFMKDIIYTPACGVNCVLSHGLYAFMVFMAIIAVAFSIIAGVDYLVQRHFYLEGLMMSHEELKQEHKESEGSHEMKSHRREMAQEIVMGNHQHAKVPSSTAVVKNPTHYAVAVYYERGVSPLPLITCKGKDRDALDIIALAEQFKIPVVEDIPLAQALYFYGQLDNYIPTDLFKPVAEFLKKAEELKTKL